jgi:hypothetical protein
MEQTTVSRIAHPEPKPVVLVVGGIGAGSSSLRSRDERALDARSIAEATKAASLEPVLENPTAI